MTGLEWWHIRWAPTPAEWSAFFALLTFVAAVVAAAIALGQLRAHFATARAQNRPYVIVDFAFRSFLMGIEIKNIGATAASDLTLTVDIPFESRDMDRTARLKDLFSGNETIAMLAPERRLLYPLDNASNYIEDKRPFRYVVTAKYKDLPVQFSRERRRPWKRVPVVHEDTYVLDFAQWSTTLVEVDYPNKNWNLAKNSLVQLKAVTNALNSISQALQSDDNDDD